MSIDIKPDLRYTNDHEWMKQDGHIATIGVSAFAATNMGDIVFVELPAVGRNLDKGATFGVIESIKSVSDLYAPVSGEVIEVNTDLANSPERINQDPYGSWMMKVKMSNISEANTLMDAKAYATHCEQH